MYNNTVNTGQDNSFRVIPRSYSPLLQARTWLGWRSDKKTTKTKKTNLKSKRVSERVRGFSTNSKSWNNKRDGRGHYDLDILRSPESKHNFGTKGTQTMAKRGSKYSGRTPSPFRGNTTPTYNTRTPP